MASNRYAAPQRAAFAALATHTGPEPVAAATGVKEHTVREWVRVNMAGRYIWASTDAKSLKFLDEFIQRLVEGHHPIHPELSEGLRCLTARSDQDDLIDADLRDDRALFSLNYETAWTLEFGKAILAAFGPCDKFLDDPVAHIDQIDFVRLGNAFIWSLEIGRELGDVFPEPCAKYWVRIEAAEGPARALADTSPDDVSTIQMLDLGAAERLRSRTETVLNALPFLIEPYTF